MIRVLVIDEDEIFRRGIIACLSEDGEMNVISGAPGQRVPSPCDVAVVSAAVAEELELDCALVVCGRVPRVPTSNRVLARLPRGGLTRGQLLAAVRGAAVGLQITRDEPEQPRFDERRLIILSLLADGADTREISQELRYSPRTIKGLISSIEQQLESRNRTHAVATALRKGLI